MHQAAQGQFASLAQMVLTDRRGAASVFSIGMALSVLCSEDAAVIARGAEVGPNGDRLDAACRVWPRGDLPQDYHQPVRAAAPVLIISGRLDPATPPRWAQEAARCAGQVLAALDPLCAPLPQTLCIDEIFFGG